jgi:hypothetical protein
MVFGEKNCVAESRLLTWVSGGRSENGLENSGTAKSCPINHVRRLGEKGSFRDPPEPLLSVIA